MWTSPPYSSLWSLFQGRGVLFNKLICFTVCESKNKKVFFWEGIGGKWARQTGRWTDNRLDKIESSAEKRALIFQIWCIIYTQDKLDESAGVLLGEWRFFDLVQPVCAHPSEKEGACVNVCVIGEAVDERQRWKRPPRASDCVIHLLVVWLWSSSCCQVDTLGGRPALRVCLPMCVRAYSKARPSTPMQEVTYEKLP